MHGLRHENRPVKILLVMPDASMHKLRVGSHVRSMREAPLTMTTLAALTPAHPDIELRLVDESVDRIPWDWPADLVAISVLTGTAMRAYAIADHFRGRGVPVVLGGVHATLLPEEAARFADSVVVGMGERTWPALIEDFRAGRLQPRYDAPPLEGDWVPSLPPPRRDLQRHSGYMMPNTVFATRGCKHVCDFCTVSAVWSRYQRRPVAEVVRDVRALGSRLFVFNDVSLLDDREYAKELLAALVPLRKRWGGLATTLVAQDAELVELLRASGCAYLLLGFESVDQAVLSEIYKGFNKDRLYEECVRTLHGIGVSVQGCFVFGFDHDDEGVFARTVERVNALRIDIPRYSLYTPYPGTRLFHRLLAEGRILSFDWSLYDTMHVVIRPAKMSPAALAEGFRWAYRETFRLRPSARRTLHPGRPLNSIVNFVGNLTYRRFVRRLDAARGFEMPYTAVYPPVPAELAARFPAPGSAQCRD